MVGISSIHELIISVYSRTTLSAIYKYVSILITSDNEMSIFIKINGTRKL